MKIQGDFDSVNLSKGEKSRKIIGDGETRIETVGPISATPAAPSADLLGERKMNAIELVKLVLSKHQMAYAKFHCTEGRKVIESHNMAIGYAAVELEKALALAPDPLLAELEKLVEKLRDKAIRWSLAGPTANGQTVDALRYCANELEQLLRQRRP